MNDISLNCCYISNQEQIFANIGSDSAFTFQEGLVKQTFISSEILSERVGIVFIIVLMEVDIKAKTPGKFVQVSVKLKIVNCGTGRDKFGPTGQDRNFGFTKNVRKQIHFTYVISYGCDIAALFATMNRTFYPTSLMGSSAGGIRSTRQNRPTFDGCIHLINIKGGTLKSGNGSSRSATVTAVLSVSMCVCDSELAVLNQVRNGHTECCCINCSVSKKEEQFTIWSPFL